MTNYYDFGAIRRQSESYGTDFNRQHRELERFENDVINVDHALKLTTFLQDNSGYVADLDYFEPKLSKKAIADILSKSKRKISIKSFEEVEALTDDRGLKTGVTILNRASEETHRTNHKFVVYDGEVRAVLNQNYPSESLKLSTLADRINDMLSLSGKESKIDLKFDVETGNVSYEVISDITELDIDSLSVNDVVGFGFSIHNNYYGNRRFSLRASTLNLACTNGLINTNAVSNLDIVHSSTQNFALKLGNWLNQHINYYDMPRNIRAVLQWLRTGRWVDPNYEDDLYNTLGATMLDVMHREKDDRIELIKAAAANSISDLEKELSQIQKREKLPATVIGGISRVFEEDDTIDSRRPNSYYLSMAISRYANHPALSFDRKEELQVLANKVLTKAAYA